MENATPTTSRRTKRNLAPSTAGDERLLALTENATDLITVVNRKGVVLYDTPSAARLLGVAPGALQGKNAFRFIHRDDLPSARRLFRELVQKPRVMRTAELRLRHRDGSWRTVEVIGKNLLANPTVAGIVLNTRDITARKRTELRLRQSEETFRALAENSPDYIVRLGPNARMLYANPATVKLFGRPLEQILNRNLDELGFPDSVWEPARRAFNEAWRTGRELTFELVHPFNGVTRYFEVRHAPEFAPDGSTASVLVLSRDITVRRQAEEALRALNATLEQRVAERTAALQQSEARLRSSARAGNVGLWDWDLRTNAVYFSPEWKRQIGYRDEEIPNRFREWQRRVHPDDLKPTLRKIRAFLRNPRGHHQVEFRFRHKDGSYRWIYTRADVLRDAKGKPVRMLGCHIDITERKRAEAALAESELRFRTIFDAAGDGMFLHELKRGRLHLANRACLDMLGYTLKEFQSLGFEELHREEDWPFIRQQIAEFRRGKVTPRLEIRFRRKDGSLLYTELHLTAVRLNGHDYALVAFHDISERRRLQAEVEHVSEMERQHLGRDLHDGLSQHLAAMAILGESLQKVLRVKKLPEVADAGKLTTYAREAVKVSHDLSRALYPAGLKIGGLAPALKELCKLVQEMFPIRCSFRNGCAQRLTDENLERQFFRIAQEATFNAAKHSKGRHIWIRLQQSKHWLTLTIKDDGIGVSEARLQANDLGLNIMKYRADLIGAALTFDAKRGRGTVVTCRLRRELR